MKRRSSARVAADSSASRSPAAGNVRRVTVLPPEEAMTASPSPARGRRGSRSSASAASTIAAGSSSSTAPASRHTASKAAKEPARLAVWLRAACAPASDRPALTQSTGLPAARPGAAAGRSGRRHQPLDIEGDDPGGRILDEEFEEVAEFQVRLVADRDAAAEPAP